MKKHLKSHRGIKHPENCTHFLTPLGNLFPIREEILTKIENEIQEKIDERTKKKSKEKKKKL